MSSLKVDYHTILSRHPVEVSTIMQALRKGKSKEKTKKAGEFEWFYSWETGSPLFSLLAMSGAWSKTEALSKSFQPPEVKP